jgi:hypothetical protein
MKGYRNQDTQFCKIYNAAVIELCNKIKHYRDIDSKIHGAPSFPCNVGATGVSAAFTGVSSSSTCSSPEGGGAVATVTGAGGRRLRESII